mgnify:FL=1
MSEEDKEVLHLVKKYESMIDKNEKIWFDSIEYVDIIDYYHDNNSYSKAEEATFRAYKLFPEDEEVAMRMAGIYVGKENYATALEVLSPCLKKSASSLVYSTLASIYIESNQNIDEAERILNKIIEEDKEDYYFNYYLLGRIYLKRSQPDKAEPLIRKALLEDPEDDDILLYYIQCAEHGDKGIKQQILSILEGIRDDYPFNDMLWQCIAAIHYDNGDLAKSLEALDYSIAIDNEDDTRHALKADILVKLNKEYEAISELEEAIKYTKEPYAYYNNIGSLFFHKKNYAEAEKNYVHAWESAGEMVLPSTLLGLVECYFLLNQPVLAKQTLEKAWSYGFDSQVFLELAERLHASGFINESEKIFSELLNDDDDDILLSALIALSYISAENGNNIEAINILEEAIRNNLISKELYFAMLVISCTDSKLFDYTKKALQKLYELGDYEEDIEKYYPDLLQNKNYQQAQNEIKNGKL